jgi:hypothetical protein
LTVELIRRHGKHYCGLCFTEKVLESNISKSVSNQFLEEEDSDGKKKKKKEPKANKDDLPPPYDEMDEVSRFHYLNSQLPSGKRFKMAPTSSWQMTYMYITGEGLILSFAPEHFAVITRALGLPRGTTINDLREHTKKEKGQVISRLLFSMNSGHGYRANVGLPRSSSAEGTSSNDKRYVLTGTFKPTTIFCRCLPLIPQRTRKSTRISRKASCQRLKIYSLIVTPFRPNFLNPKGFKVIGIDLGEVFTVAACYKTGPGVVNLTIKKKALYQPTLKARNEREHRKTRLVYRTESLIPMRRELNFADAVGYAKKVINSLTRIHSRRFIAADDSNPWIMTLARRGGESLMSLWSLC